MKYDKYGDLIAKEVPKTDAKTRKAFLVVTFLQIVLITVNLMIIFIDSLNTYLSFVTAPLYIFLYINFLKGYGHHKDLGTLPGYLKIVKILSPIFYGITSFLVIIIGF